MLLKFKKLCQCQLTGFYMREALVVKGLRILTGKTHSQINSSAYGKFENRDLGSWYKPTIHQSSYTEIKFSGK